MGKPPPDPLFVLRAHQADITALRFVSEKDCEIMKIIGPSLISGTKCGEIFIWNLKINRVQFKLNDHDKKMIISLDYLENNIISQGKNDFVNIWCYNEDTNIWTTIRKIRSPEYGFCPASLCCYQLKHYFIIPSSETGSFTVTDYNCGSLVTEIKPPSHGMCMCIQTCSWKDELLAVCGYEDGALVTWTVEKGVICNFSCHNDPVFCLDIDMQHQQRGVSGSADQYLKTWNIDNDFQLSAEKEVKLNSGINCTSIRADGMIVIAGCWNGNLHVFSWKSLKPLAVLNFHKNSITCLQFCNSKIGKHDSVFASASKDFNIALWTIY